jgi:hypothetical protein
MRRREIVKNDLVAAAVTRAVVHGAVVHGAVVPPPGRPSFRPRLLGERLSCVNAQSLALSIRSASLNNESKEREVGGLHKGLVFAGTVPFMRSVSI